MDTVVVEMDLKEDNEVPPGSKVTDDGADATGNNYYCIHIQKQRGREGERKRERESVCVYVCYLRHVCVHLVLYMCV